MYGADNVGQEPTVFINQRTIAANADHEISISARSLQRDHTVILLLDQVEPGTSFELEVVRHFEGTSNEAGKMLESKSCELPLKYSTAFDIIRQLDRPYAQTPLSRHFEIQYGMRGIFDSPIFQKMADIVKMGLTESGEPFTMKGWLRKAAPNLARLLLHKIPGLDMIADPIAHGIEAALERGMKGK